MGKLYDRIGINYSVKRCTDPYIANKLYAEIADAEHIINIGAGTGSYEPEGKKLMAVEPSIEMILQRSREAYPVAQAFAEKLPFNNKRFSHAMTVLSMHHWQNRAQAFSEISRVTTDKFVAISWVPDTGPFWLTRDYFPGIYAADAAKGSFPSLDELEYYFDNVQMTPLLIPADCQDGFLAAFWKRPEAYLNPEVRQSISSFSKIDKEALSVGLSALQNDLSGGTWAKKNHELLSQSVLDSGYRLITAKIKDSQ